jgi:alpha-amylase
VRDEAMRDYYKALLQIRRAHPALRRGDYTLLSGPQEPLLAYVRHDAGSGDSVLVLVNREDRELAADFLLPEAWSARPVTDELSSTAVATAAGRIVLSMAPKSVRILSVTSGKAEH